MDCKRVDGIMISKSSDLGFGGKVISFAKDVDRFLRQAFALAGGQSGL